MTTPDPLTLSDRLWDEAMALDTLARYFEGTWTTPPHSAPAFAAAIRDHVVSLRAIAVAIERQGM